MLVMPTVVMLIMRMIMLDMRMVMQRTPVDNLVNII
jgi:hypothetical protein